MDCWQRYTWALENCRTLFVHGPPGVGKTYLSYQHQMDDRELFAMTLGEEASSIELRGHYISKGAEKGTTWHDGPLTQAVRANHPRFVVNEISNASPDILGMLYAILEDPVTAKLTLPTGETLSVGEKFQCVFTDNFNPDRALPQALKDRIEAFVHCTEPHEGALEAIAKPLRGYARNAITTGLSGLRSWRHLSRYLSEGLNTDDAVQLAFGEVNETMTSIIADAIQNWTTTPKDEPKPGVAPEPSSKATLVRGSDGLIRVVRNS